jgi:hypothetical protein
MKTLLLFSLTIVAAVLVGACSNIDTTGNNNPNRTPSQAGLAGTGGGGGGGGPAGMPKQLP